MIIGTTGSPRDPMLARIPCPTCGCRGRYRFHGSYERWCVAVRRGKRVEGMVTVARVKHLPCGHTHALLPRGCVPRSPYSESFWRNLASFRSERGLTVWEVCAEFGIDARTLYSAFARKRAGPTFAVGENGVPTCAHDFPIHPGDSVDYLAVIST